MTTKIIKIYHCIADIDIGNLLSSLQTRSTTQEMSHTSHGAVFQFRRVQDENGVILGQFRKAIIDGKPTIGDAYSDIEDELREAVMHHCHFLYNKNNKVMLIEQNIAVSATPHASIAKVISKIFPNELPEGLGIRIFAREDAIRKVKENRGEIQGFEFAIDRETKQYMNLLTGELNDITDQQLDDLYTKTINIKSKISSGSLTDAFIERLVSRLDSGRFFKLKFNLPRRESIDIKDFKKTSKIQVKLTDNQHLDIESVYNELKRLNETESN